MKRMQSLNKPRLNRGKPIILFDIDYTLFDTALFKKTNFKQYSLFKEVPDVLSDLSKQLILGIFSQGEKTLQSSKLKATKIHHLFREEHIHIELQKEEKIKTIVEKYKNTQLYIADDKLLVLSLMKKQRPKIFTIWIKRGIYAENQEPLPGFTPDAIMEDLSGIVRIIEQRHGIILHSH